MVLAENCLCSSFLSPYQETDGIGYSQGSGNGVGNVPAQIQANLGIDDKATGLEAVEGSGNQWHPNPLSLAVFKHPDNYGHKGKEGQGLVGPSEVAPQYVEAAGVALCPYQDSCYKHKEDGGQENYVKSYYTYSKLQMHH